MIDIAESVQSIWRLHVMMLSKLVMRTTT